MHVLEVKGEMVGLKILIKIKYLGLIGSKIGKKVDEVELLKGASVSDLLEKLAGSYGEVLKNLFYVKKDARYVLFPAFVVTINDVLIDKLDGMKTQLKDGDNVALLMSVSGG